ncbi:alpha/beta fold hydrolase [Nannocystaceae bacterium ST9]
MPEHPSDPPVQRAVFDGRTIGWVDAGAGPITLVMVHGLPGSHRDFRWLAPSLEPHARVVRLDMPGFGESSAISTRLSPIAEHVLRRLDQLGLDRVVLVGHSFGGPSALLAASRSPDRVVGLALLASVGLRPHRALRAFQSRLPWVTRGLRTPLLRRPMMRLTQAAMQRAGFPKRTPAHETHRSVDIVARVDFVAIRNAAAALRVPTLIAWAEDDPLVEPAIAEELGVALPAGPRIGFTTGGHNIQKTRADELGAAMVDWIHGLALNPVARRDR